MFEYLTSNIDSKFPVALSFEELQSEKGEDIPYCSKDEVIKLKIKKLRYVLRSLKNKLDKEKRKLAKEKMQSQLYAYPYANSSEPFAYNYGDCSSAPEHMQRSTASWNPVHQNPAVKTSDSLNFIDAYKNFISDNVEKMYTEEYSKVKVHLNKIKKTSPLNESNQAIGDYPPNLYFEKRDYKLPESSSHESLENEKNEVPSRSNRDEKIKSKIHKLGFVLNNLRGKLAEEREKLAKAKMQSEPYPHFLYEKTPPNYAPSFSDTFSSSQYSWRPNSSYAPWMHQDRYYKIKPSNSSNFMRMHHNSFNDNIERISKEQYYDEAEHSKKKKKKSQIDFNLSSHDSSLELNNISNFDKAPESSGSRRHRKHHHHHRHHHKHRTTSKGFQIDITDEPSFTNLPSTSGIKPCLKSSSTIFDANAVNLKSLHKDSVWDLSGLDGLL